MAFPTNGVFDDFNRADNTDLGANWAAFASYTALRILSNAVACRSGQPSGGEYYSAATFGPDCEFYADLVGPITTNQTFAIWARVTTPTGSYDAYETEVVIAAGTDQVFIYRFDDAAATQLGATISQNFAAGESLGLECSGSNITAYRKSGGTWSSLGTRSDATYNSAGNFAFYHDDQGNDSGWDNAGGGTIAAATKAPPPFRRSMRFFPRRAA